MALKQPQVDQVYDALLDAAEGKKQVSWSEMVAAVNNTKVKVTNWMDVRGVLQFMINQGMFKRTSDLKVEVYDVFDI